MPKKKGNEIRYERDMYAPVKAWLEAEGWEVKAEVARCDGAAVKDGRLLALEMKLTLNLDVVLQALERQRMADCAYIAVPRKPKLMAARRWREAIALLQRLNLGLLVVNVQDGQADVEEALVPTEDGTAKRGYAAHRRAMALREFDGRTGDYNTGGVHGQKLITAYREASLAVAAKLAKDGPLNAPRLIPRGFDRKRTYTLLRDNHYGWFRPVGGGRFDLTDHGREEMKIYSGLLDRDAGPFEENVFGGAVEE